jgi:hypothetical protein
MPRLLAGFLVLFVIAGLATGAAAGEWTPEAGVAAPSYAVAEPLHSDLNVDTVVLSCERGPSRRGLQLRLYLSGDGPLAPVSGGALKDGSVVELVIDGTSHHLQPLFADDFVVLADAGDGTLPLLSDGLVDALQKAQRLELRFDRTVVELPAGQDGAAIAAVRRCADAPAGRVAEMASRTPTP